MCLVTAGGQNMMLDPQELELQVVACHHVDAGIEPRSSRRLASFPNHWAISGSWLIALDAFSTFVERNMCWNRAGQEAKKENTCAGALSLSSSIPPGP